MERCGDQHWPYWKAAIRFALMLESAKHGMEHPWQALSSAVNERREKEKQARLEAERRQQAMLCQQRLDDFRKNLAVGALTNMGKVVKKEGNTFFFEENQCAREEMHQSRERVATIINTGCPTCVPQSVYDLVQTRQCVEWKTVLIGRNRSQLKPARAAEDCP